ncbi:MAG: acyl-CoA synthetase [Actinobacteria bacterium ATB1]|nr:acyl-CoA synthetase [Actinobacteria bacterium ATB1]
MTEADRSSASLGRALLDALERFPERPALVERDGTGMSWAELGARAGAVATVLRSHRPEDGPFHVGILAPNVREWPELVMGSFMAGATVVGLNTTRHGADLARDVSHARCCVVVAQESCLEETRLPDTGVPIVRLGAEYEARIGCAQPVTPDVRTRPDDIAFLLFTSGSTSAPKAVIRTHGAAVASGRKMASRLGIDETDVGYVSMPLFHGGAVMTVLVPALLTGAAVGLRARFSVSEFLPDVRALGATWWGYTGKPLAYLLSSPEGPDDGDNPLRVAIGNEGNTHNCEEFARRFDCEVIDFYGSTEGGVGLVRSTADPPGALGRAPDGVRILSPEGNECPAARFDGNGRMVNADEAIGEIVNTAGLQVFEGYWDNPDATAERTRGGIYHSGDLGYRDEDGFLYFAGRTDDWVRVDGENFATATVERLLESHPGVVTAAVVAVPDVAAGDQLLAIVEPAPGTDLDAPDLVAWMRDNPVCGSKWIPRYFRITDHMPMSGTHKIDRRTLRRDGVKADGVLERTVDGSFVPVDVDALRVVLAARGREHLLGL